MVSPLSFRKDKENYQENPDFQEELERYRWRNIRNCLFVIKQINLVKNKLKIKNSLN